MGNARYEAWKDGTPFKDFVTFSEHPTWGRSLTPTPVGKLGGVKVTGAPVSMIPEVPEFATTTEADEWAAAQKSLNPEPTFPEHQSLKKYKGDAYSNLNYDLRKYGHSDNPIVTDIDVMIGKSRIEAPGVRVYRGGDKRTAAIFGDVGDSIGTEIQDRAYVSTTLNRQSAESMTFGHGTLIEIEIPQGAPGLYMEPYSVLEYSEAELLLPRDSVFKVVNDEVIGDTRHLKVRWVGQAEHLTGPELQIVTDKLKEAEQALDVMADAFFDTKDIGVGKGIDDKQLGDILSMIGVKK